MNNKTLAILTILTAIVTFKLWLGCAPDILPVPMEEIAVEELNSPLVPPPVSERALPEVIQSLPEEYLSVPLTEVSASGLSTCLDFEVLDDRMQDRIIREAMQDTGLVGFDLCVRDRADKGRMTVIKLCRRGVSLAVAFDRALSYYQHKCTYKGNSNLDLEDEFSEEPFNLNPLIGGEL